MVLILINEGKEMKVKFEGVPNYVWNWLIGILIIWLILTGISCYLRSRTIKYMKQQIEAKKQEISEETRINIKAIEMLDILVNEKKEEKEDEHK
jgi:predicted Holliday junction resolvase-like endonuclease